jgi:hypothetical protein
VHFLFYPILGNLQGFLFPFWEFVDPNPELVKLIVTLANCYTNLTLPVSSSCIMPCLTWRALASLFSRAAIWASMSLRISAMAV